MPTSLIRHKSKYFHIRDVSGCHNIIIYEIGFVLHSHWSSSFAYQQWSRWMQQMNEDTMKQCYLLYAFLTEFW